MSEVYGDECSKKTMIYKWVERFSDGWKSVEDAPRSGRPSSTIFHGNIEYVKKVIYEDRRTTQRTGQRTRREVGNR